MYNHVNIILDKRSRGQPVSFTDFFGYLVGETILKDVSTQIPLFQASLILAPSRGLSFDKCTPVKMSRMRNTLVTPCEYIPLAS